MIRALCASLALLVASPAYSQGADLAAKARARVEKMDFWQSCRELRRVVKKSVKARSELEVETMLYISTKLGVGGDEWDLIKKGQARVGMSQCGAAASWGQPKDINTTTTRYGSRSQWVYGGGNYLYIANDRVEAIQN